MNKKKEDNLDPKGRLQSVAGENKIGKGYIGETVHDVIMDHADPHPDSTRDRLKA